MEQASLNKSDGPEDADLPRGGESEGYKNKKKTKTRERKDAERLIRKPWGREIKGLRGGRHERCDGRETRRFPLRDGGERQSVGAGTIVLGVERG